MASLTRLHLYRLLLSSLLYDRLILPYQDVPVSLLPRACRGIPSACDSTLRSLQHVRILRKLVLDYLLLKFGLLGLRFGHYALLQVDTRGVDGRKISDPEAPKEFHACAQLISPT